MSRWVALLRAVNVGGRKLVMADLCEAAASLGWGDVRTYIQSGNLVFDADGAEADLASALTRELRDRSAMDVPVIVRSADDMTRIAAAHPDADGDVEARFLHVHLLDRAPETVEGVEPDGFAPDTWTLDGREVYVTYPSGSGRSKLVIQVFERAWDVVATGRNLNTIRKLADLAAGSGEAV